MRLPNFIVLGDDSKKVLGDHVVGNKARDQAILFADKFANSYGVYKLDTSHKHLPESEMDKLNKKYKRKYRGTPGKED